MKEVKSSGKRQLLIGVALVGLQILQGTTLGLAQVSNTPQSPQDDRPALAKYVDPVSGMTADDAVAYALAHNGELQAARKEIDAAQALVKQAGLRPNPRLDVNGSRQINGKDNSVMVQGALPLELGGRRSARIAVAERELEMRKLLVADRERVLAAEVR